MHLIRLFFCILLFFSIDYTYPSDNKSYREGVEHFNLGKFFEKQQKFEKAIYHYQCALKIFNEEKSYLKSAESLYQMGKIYRAENKIDKAAALLEESLVLYTGLKDTTGMIACHAAIGLMYADNGQDEPALKYYLGCINLSEKRRDTLFLVAIMSNVAGIYGAMIDTSMCLQYNLKALSILEKVDPGRAGMNKEYFKVYSYILNNLGMNYMNRDPEKATDYFYRSLKLKKSINDFKGISFIYGNLGETFMDRNDLKSAEIFFMKGLKLSDSLGDPLCRSVANHSMGMLCFKTGRISTALNYFFRSLDYAGEYGFHDQRQEDMLMLSRSYEKGGQYKDALLYFQEYSELKDSRFRSESQKAVAEMNTKYETAIKENKILEMQKEDLRKSSQIRQSGFWIVFLSVFILAVISYTLFRIRSYRRKLDDLRALVRQDLELDQKEKREEDVTTIIPEKEPKSVISDATREKLSAELINLIVKNKRFLDPDITLSEIAKELETNTSYLSRIINEDLAENFNQFINSHRVREARHMLIDPSYLHLSIEGIAHSCGFKSKSVFNSVFKKITGVTPSFYQRSAPDIALTEQPPDYTVIQATCLDN